MHSHPEAADTLIVGAQLYDGTGAPPVTRDVAIRNGAIAAIGNLSNWLAETVVDANGRALAPGFVDVHTHDDTHVIRAPEMLPKISQGVTTVIVGNCGISASPVTLAGNPPDPMNLLGERDAFRYPTFADYVPVVSATVTDGTRKAYGSYWNRIVDQWGARRLDEPTPSEIKQLVAYVKANVVPRRNARGGRSAAENLIAALRCLYKRAEEDGFIDERDNPARKVAKPRRLPSTRRAVADVGHRRN